MIKRNFLQKMLFFYISIVVLYTSILSAFTCYKSFEFSSLQADYSNERYINQAGASIDYKLDTAFRLLYKLITMKSFIEYSNSDTVDYLNITNFYNDMSSLMQGFNHLGISIAITRPEDNLVITPEGTYSYNNFLKTYGIDINSFWDYMNLNQPFPSEDTCVLPDSVMKNSDKIMLFCKMSRSSSDPPFHAFITLSKSSLLAEDNDKISDHFYLYTDELVSQFHQSDTDHTETLNFLEQMDPSLDISTLKTDDFISYIHSSDIIPELKYVYTVPVISMFSVMADTLKDTLLPTLVLLLIGFLLSYRAARSSYRPIHALVNFISEQNDTQPPSVKRERNASELDYIQSNVEHMLTVNRMLKNRLNNSIVRLQDDFFRKVIYGIADKTFISDNLAPLQLEAFDTQLRLLLLDLEGIENLTTLISYRNFSLLIDEIIREYPSWNRAEFVVALDTKKYCIILKDAPEDELITLGNHIIDAISSHLSIDVSGCLSSTYPLDNLTSGLHELLTLCNYKYSFSSQQIITTAALKDLPDTTAVYYYPLEAETCLINYIAGNEYQKGKELISELIEKNLQERSLSPSNLTHLKYAMLTTFKRCLNTDNKSLNQFIRENPTLINSFMEAAISQFTEETFSLYETVFHYCNHDKFSLENSTASKIFMYIHENFDKDLSLTDIADCFGLSESYISKLFKNSLDINFKTYVNKLKVKKAKELFQQGNCKVSDVSAIVGCNNVNTFIRIFKQYEGISPGEYVKSLKGL